MLKFITTVLLSFILAPTFGQVQRKVSTYLLTSYNKTIYDGTIGNNPWGVGLGLQTIFNNKTKFKPTIELTGDIYLEDDDIFRAYSDKTEIKDVRSSTNLFIGSSFYPTKNVYLSFLAGPSFINGQALLGVKSSFGFYFSSNQKWTGKISYINIFNRDKRTKEDFGSLSFSIGIKLF